MDIVARETLGRQGWAEGKPPRFLAYCVAVGCEGGTLLHNVMTKELLLLEGDEGRLIDAGDLNASRILGAGGTELFRYLWENWYIVPCGHDDMELCLGLRAVARQLRGAKDSGSLAYFTILSTTACNARCFYCYERGTKHVDMSRETALGVVDFIGRTCGGSDVSLHWFGGEPLLNTMPIDVITDGLAKSGIRFASSMTTNGYLFDDEMVARARERWRLEHVQITLDGTEEVHNRRKAFVYKDGSAFARTNYNIERLLGAGMAVCIRMNLDGDNFGDLTTLADYICQRYGRHDKLTAYAKELHGGKAYRLSGNERTLTKQVRKLNQRIAAGGKGAERRLADKITLYGCMADDRRSVLIQANGELGKCQHFFNSHPCGTLATGTLDTTEMAHYAEPDRYPETCGTCPIRPDCIRLAVCPYSFASNSKRVATGGRPYECADKVEELRLAMLGTYDRCKEAVQTTAVNDYKPT